MPYQEQFHFDGPSRQHYEDRIANYAEPSPHRHDQRVTATSERGFDPMRNYEYENGAHGTRGRREYNNRVQAHTWSNAPYRHDLNQPSSYGPAHREAQVTYDRRYDRQSDIEQANPTKVSNGSQGRGRGRDQGIGPGFGSDTRPGKMQKNEALVHVQMQPKPRMSVLIPHLSLSQTGGSAPDRLAKSGVAVKQSIIPQPTSPVSTAWDNPFPTFPTGRSKPKPAEGRILSDTMGEVKISDGARENGSPESWHQRKSKNKESPDIAKSRHHPENLVEQGSIDHHYHFIHSGINHPWVGQQGKVEYTRITPGSAQNSIHPLSSRSAHDNRFLGHTEVHKRREQMSDHSERIRPAQPLPPATAFKTDSQRSMTLPGEFTALRLESDLPQSYPGSSEWQEPGPTGAYYGPDSHVIIPQRPATSGGQRSSEKGYPGLSDATHSYKTSVDTVARPDVSKSHLRKHGLGEFIDSYGVPKSEDPNTGPGAPDCWPSLEDEMSNFDIVPTTSAEDIRHPTFEHPLRTQGSGSGLVPWDSSTLVGVQTHQDPYSEGPVSQSIFQPDHGGGSQLLPDNSTGFVFELVGDEPALPPGVASRSDGRSKPLYEHKVKAISYRQDNDHADQPYKLGMTSGMEASRSAGGFDHERSQDDWQRHARNQHVPPLPPQLETPALRAHTRARAAHPQISSGSGDQPVSGQQPSSDPDALPEHPTPMRPGLMQGTMGSQVPRPPPVRQYENSPSSIQQNGNIPQKPPSGTSQKKGSLTPVTLGELVKLRQVIKANPKDQKTQLLLAKRMVEAASILADEGGRADPKTTSKNREKYIFDAHKMIKKLVNGGNADAMFYLADCHGRGLLGLESDDKEAFTLYQSAAKAGHAQSAYRVAVCCEMGQEGGGGTRRDPLKAMQWYKRAAMLGDTPAMYKMGMILLKGLLGQSRNSREAIVWLKRAADRADEENPHALHELGLLYENASGNDHIIRDERYSKQLFTQAAELGYKFSQFRLGCAYEYGLMGCAIDPRQSIAWYSRAAIQGEHQSELALSGWYLTGSEGVLQQSDTEAYLWARKAAHAGLAKAEFAMGYFTEVGIGAPASIEDAKRWYWRAASQNFPQARERLEDLRKGGAKMQKSRVSRSAVNKQSEGDCILM